MQALAAICKVIFLSYDSTCRGTWSLNPPAFSLALEGKAPLFPRWLKAFRCPRQGARSKGSLFTFADTNLVTKIILLIVKLTPQPGATLHAIHAWPVVAGFSQLRGAHLRQQPQSSSTVLYSAGQLLHWLLVTGARTIHRVLEAPGPRQVRGDQQRGQQQEALMFSAAPAPLPAAGFPAGGSRRPKVVAERLPTRLWVLYTGLPACFPVINFLNPAAALSSGQALLF